MSKEEFLQGERRQCIVYDHTQLDSILLVGYVMVVELRELWQIVDPILRRLQRVWKALHPSKRNHGARELGERQWTKMASIQLSDTCRQEDCDLNESDLEAAPSMQG